MTGRTSPATKAEYEATLRAMVESVKATTEAIIRQQEETTKQIRLATWRVNEMVRKARGA